MRLILDWAIKHLICQYEALDRSPMEQADLEAEDHIGYGSETGSQLMSATGSHPASTSRAA